MSFVESMQMLDEFLRNNNFTSEPSITITFQVPEDEEKFKRALRAEVQSFQLFRDPKNITTIFGMPLKIESQKHE